MLVALLAVLGVDLIVVVVFLGFSAVAQALGQAPAWVLPRRHPRRQRRGRRSGPKWSRGYGRWVSDVLVWTKAPFLFGHAFEVAASDDDRERLLGPHRQPAAAAEAAAIAAQPTPT